jgi:hypothetical protein
MTASWTCDEKEKTRRLVDLALVSVLLDAGAGPTWPFTDPQDGLEYSRSEGLGVASFHMFCSGCFSSDPLHPFQVDAKALLSLPADSVAKAFQVVSLPSSPLPPPP